MPEKVLHRDDEASETPAPKKRKTLLTTPTRVLEQAKRVRVHTWNGFGTNNRLRVCATVGSAESGALLQSTTWHDYHNTSLCCCWSMIGGISTYSVTTHSVCAFSSLCVSPQTRTPPAGTLFKVYRASPVNVKPLLLLPYGL